VLERADQPGEYILRQPLSLSGDVEDVLAEDDVLVSGEVEVVECAAVRCPLGGGNVLLAGRGHLLEFLLMARLVESESQTTLASPVKPLYRRLTLAEGDSPVVQPPS